MHVVTGSGPGLYMVIPCKRAEPIFVLQASYPGMGDVPGASFAARRKRVGVQCPAGSDVSLWAIPENASSRYAVGVPASPGAVFDFLSVTIAVYHVPEHRKSSPYGTSHSICIKRTGEGVHRSLYFLFGQEGEYPAQAPYLPKYRRRSSALSVLSHATSRSSRPICP